MERREISAFDILIAIALVVFVVEIVSMAVQAS